MILLDVNNGAAPQGLNFIELLMKGGPMMVPLLLLSVLAVLLIIERSMYLSKNAALGQSSIKKLSELPKGDAQLKYCQELDNAWGQVMSYGVQARSMAEADKLMEDAANVEVARLEKNMNYLTIIAGVAPLLGFVGTIIGVITIFYDISISQDISISVISTGLYQKMVSSATGLVVGIVAYSGYHLLNLRIDRFVNQLQDDVLKFKLLKGYNEN